LACDEDRLRILYQSSSQADYVVLDEWLRGTYDRLAIS